ncbi:phosphohistidine phosphatase [Solimonas aquatica]|uniref:Phosphohistidine phosphatase n=1 Tax=Solimonas aquatica TaxID=489703 RepID=A0A1H9I4X7_9GAMM|nr:histidine phosphatase family protein [Solimonas aquatica]SEQ69572.1 phosphohistidine phosphatase [Solimonas aquatica]
MLRLTLIRHAKSSWADDSLDDFERPLNERGRRDAPRMAALAQRELETPARLVTSPALRAISTARVFAETLGIPHDSLLVLPGIYEASGDALLKLLRGMDDCDQHLMLFGHNPGLSELAHYLAPCSFSELPTCAVAHLELDRARWRELGEHCGHLAYYVTPKQLRGGDSV